VKFEVFENKQASGATSPARRRRVLIVDGDVSMSRFLSLHLTKRNFDVSSAASGEEAIGMFRTLNPNLVFLDLALPGMDGLETLERLREIKPDVVVIVSSVLRHPELIFKASKAGADD
jgi:DNA-binding response OmpR family regulator